MCYLSLLMPYILYSITTWGPLARIDGLRRTKKFKQCKIKKKAEKVKMCKKKIKI